jgi:hypothetical protein
VQKPFISLYEKIIHGPTLKKTRQFLAGAYVLSFLLVGYMSVGGFASLTKIKTIT